MPVLNIIDYFKLVNGHVSHHMPLPMSALRQLLFVRDNLSLITPLTLTLTLTNINSTLL